MQKKSVVLSVDYPRGFFTEALFSADLGALCIVDESGSRCKRFCRDPKYVSEELTVPFSSIEEVVRGIKEKFSRYDIVAVCTFVEDYVILCHQLTLALGLQPFFRDPNLLRDKFAMKECLRAGGLPVAAGRLCRNYEELEANALSLGFPVVVKPLSSTGSRGVIRVNSLRGLKEAYRWQQLIGLGGTKDPRFLVEEYLDGDEFAVEFTVRDGIVSVHLISDKPVDLSGPYFEESIYVGPTSLDINVQSEILSTLNRSCALLGISGGACHAELRRCGDSINVLEIAGRPGSPMEYVSACLGFSYEQCVLAAFLQLPFERDSTPSPAGYFLLPVENGGFFVELEGADKCRAIPGVIDVKVWVQKGDYLVPPPDFHGYVGTIYAKGSSRSDLIATFSHCKRMLTLHVSSFCIERSD